MYVLRNDVFGPVRVKVRGDAVDSRMYNGMKLPKDVLEVSTNRVSEDLSI